MAQAALIDTHVMIWLVAGSGPASAHREGFGAGRTRLIVSAVSAFEIGLRVRLGELAMARPLLSRWPDVMSRIQARELAVSSAHGLAAGALEWAHGDPFDRLLVAQARVEDLTLITADRVMLTAPDVAVLPW